MPDFVYSTVNSSFTNKFRDTILPYDCKLPLSHPDDYKANGAQWQSSSSLISTWARALSKIQILSLHLHSATEMCHSHTSKRWPRNKIRHTTNTTPQLPSKPNSQARRRAIRRHNNNQHPTAVKDPHIPRPLRHPHRPLKTPRKPNTHRKTRPIAPQNRRSNQTSLRRTSRLDPPRSTKPPSNRRTPHKSPLGSSIRWIHFPLGTVARRYNEVGR